MAPTSFKLNNGLDMPALGLGTWQSPHDEVVIAVKTALKLGYKMVDAAYAYSNETAVGQGIREAIAEGYCKREDIFVVTKLWNTFADRVEYNLDLSLKELGLDYVDQYLVHWPVHMNHTGDDNVRIPFLPDGKTRDVNYQHDHVETWKQMEAVLKTGKVKSIGVSNYSVPYLKKLLAQTTVVPAVNQIENHPLCPQQEVVDFCKEKGIHIVAYSPLGSTGGPLLKKESILKIAEKRGCSAGTVLLSYHVARGNSVLAKSVTPSRIESNMVIVDLDDSDMSALNACVKEEGIQRTVFPAFGIDLGWADKASPELKKMKNGAD